MRLTVLGSGSTVPHPRRSSAGFWIDTNGGSLLLDCSAAVPLRMAQERLDWPNLDAIWISHFHIDHCAGLLPLLAGIKHAEQMKDRSKPLRIWGPYGLKGLLEGFNSVNDFKLFEQPFPVEVNDVGPLARWDLFDGVEAIAMSTPHTTESHALRIEDSDGRTLVYSSDTGFGETISTFANGVDLLILECTYFQDKPAKKHLEMAEAIFLTRKAKPKRALFTHFYPEWDEVDFNGEVAKLEPGVEIIQAEDGLTMTI